MSVWQPGQLYLEAVRQLVPWIGQNQVPVAGLVCNMAGIGISGIRNRFLWQAFGTGQNLAAGAGFCIKYPLCVCVPGRMVYRRFRNTGAVRVNLVLAGIAGIAVWFGICVRLAAGAGTRWGTAGMGAAIGIAGTGTVS